MYARAGPQFKETMCRVYGGKHPGHNVTPSLTTPHLTPVDSYRR